jgi:transcription antitermination factor NusG
MKEYVRGQIVGYMPLVDAQLSRPSPQRWYVKRCTPGRDAKVVKALSLHKVDAWSPTIVKIIDRQTGQIARQPHLGRTISKPFLAGLIFIPDFELDRPVLRARDMIDGLGDFVRVADRLASISVADIATLHAIVDAENDRFKYQRAGRGQRGKYKPGDRICIVDGPFAKFFAEVERLDSHGRLKVFIEALMRGVSVELSETQVEPAGDRHRGLTVSTSS